MILYHELSHAFRIVKNAQLSHSKRCNPSSAEENAAILEENQLRLQMAAMQSAPPSLRDPHIYCGRICSKTPTQGAETWGHSLKEPRDLAGERLTGFQGAVESMVEVQDGHELRVSLVNPLDTAIYCIVDVRAVTFDHSARRLRVQLSDLDREQPHGFIDMAPTLDRIAPRTEALLTIRLPKTIVRLASAPPFTGRAPIEEHAVRDAEEIQVEIGWDVAPGRAASTTCRKIVLP